MDWLLLFDFSPSFAFVTQINETNLFVVFCFFVRVTFIVQCWFQINYSFGKHFNQLNLKFILDSKSQLKTLSLCLSVTMCVTQDSNHSLKPLSLCNNSTIEPNTTLLKQSALLSPKGDIPLFRLKIMHNCCCSR